MSTTDKTTTTTAKAAGGEYSSPRSLMRVLGMLELLAEARDGMSLAEISQTLKAPKSSLLALLRPMVAEGYFTSIGGRYNLGPPSYRLATNILSGRRFTKLIRPYVEHLVEVTGETAILATIDKDSRRVVYIEVVESRQTIRYAVPPGTTRPLYASTAGRVLLAHQDQTWRESYLETEKFKAMTANTLIDKDGLRKDLDQIVSQGYAVGFGQMVQGAAAISTPLFDASGKVVAALMVGAPTDRLQANLVSYKDAIMDTALRASGDLRKIGTVVSS
jgi:IclR family acetate operon transcriptional repressor